MNPHRLLPALLLLTACSFEPAGEVQLCERDEDCAPGRACVQARCAPDDLIDALDMGGGQDLGAPDLSSPPDMPAPDMLALDMPEVDMPTPDMPAPDMTVEPDPCEADVDQDGFGSGPRCPVGRRDCDDNDRLVYPGAPQRCNGRDNDCDSQIDADACDCMPGEREACGLTEGACEAGERVCQQDGRWGECAGGQEPLPETCNGRDDNCDGATDETFPGRGDACDTGLPGVCAPGRQTCVQGGSSCAQLAFSSVEVCDGLDNDCDGLVDEDDGGLVLARPCGNMCPSRAVQLCIGGAWGACDVTDIELCNGQDTNCDQLVDNASRCVRVCPGGRTASGTQRCGAGGAVCTMPAEICGDMLDNDCDGQVDESCGTALELRNMVYLAGGTFAMGATQSDPYAQDDERPIHLVELSPFYMDRFEATRAQYQACVQAGACAQLNPQCPAQPLSGQDANKPAACVRWQDARDYCVWAGKRLPTEAEWERAARGPWRRAPLWPWGDVEDPARARMACQSQTLNQCVGAVDSLPAGQSVEGIYHMAGNVAEYVSDFYDAAFYTPQLAINPQRTAATTDGHSVRGGSWLQALRFGRTANRAAESASFGLSRSEAGIRCARSAP